MKLKLAQFSTNMLFALVMGVFWGTWFALSRSIAAVHEQTFLDSGHTMRTFVSIGALGLTTASSLMEDS